MKINDTTLCDRWYQALLERAVDFTGIFFVGVKTTGVLCISVCRARKPKRENVEFYSTMKSALDAGFRPCKICHPTENSGSAPDFIQQALRLVELTPKERVGDSALRQQGISPERVRRWFLNQHGMTFQAFQRSQRINVALQELKSGKSTTDVAFASGYESLSGFGYTCKKLTGHAPSNAQQIVLIHRFTTPLGPMFVCASERGVCLLEFVDRRMLETEFRDIQQRLNANILPGENQHICQAVQQIGEYFAGQRLQFNLSLDLPGSAFQSMVWQSLIAIPFGETTSYQFIAQQIAKPSAVRAVASANGANRVAIVVPCHRVIGKDGALLGYGGGVARKAWLIDHEKKVKERVLSCPTPAGFSVPD